MTRLIAAETAARVPWHHTLRPVKLAGNVPVDRAVLAAGHAECPNCGAFVRGISSHGAGVHEVVAGWCDVCCMTTYFAPTS